MKSRREILESGAHACAGAIATLCSLLGALLLTASAAAQTSTIGNLVPGGGNAGIGARLLIDLSSPADVAGNLNSATFDWSNTSCTMEVKIKFFRPSGDTLQFVTERGPFNSFPMTVALTPPVAVQAGDLIGIAEASGSCGNPTGITPGKAAGSLVFASDVSGNVPRSSGTVFPNFTLAVFATGPAGAGGGPSAQVSTYSALLTGANETPNPADPDGVGFIVMTLDPSAGTITFTAFALNIATPTASHIHRGAAGVTASPLIAFNVAFVGGVSSGTVTGIAPSLLAEIIANPSGFYFNIHNADFPGGAIRGQLRPAPATFAPTVVYLPVTVKVTGARGENFVEHVRLLNRASAAAGVVVDFFASNSAGLSGPTSSKILSIAAGAQLVLNDILGSTFGVSGIGALRITADHDVIAEGIILNDKRSSGAGTYGFFIHGLQIEGVCRFGTLPVLSQASASDVAAGVGFRTNVGYFNPNAFSVTATFNARKTADGSSVGSVTVTVPAFSHAQLPVFSLINTVATPDQTQDDFYVGYTVSGGTLFVYAAVADDFTGDSYYTTGVCPP